MAGAEDTIAAHVNTQAGLADTRCGATVRFGLAVSPAYVDAVLRLIGDLVARNPDIKDRPGRRAPAGVLSPRRSKCTYSLAAFKLARTAWMDRNKVSASIGEGMKPKRS
jgi:hypothetical protein